jgi:hypothetical protein
LASSAKRIRGPNAATQTHKGRKAANHFNKATRIGISPDQCSRQAKYGFAFQTARPFYEKQLVAPEKRTTSTRSLKQIWIKNPTPHPFRLSHDCLKNANLPPFPEGFCANSKANGQSSARFSFRNREKCGLSQHRP